MKSAVNDTIFDDKLFFQVITTSLEKILNSPNEQLKATASDKTIKIAQDKYFPVYATASGILCMDKDELRINHENNITTVYSGITPSEDLKNGQKIKQKQLIGQSKNCELKIEINPVFMVKEK